ncbi:MAG: 2Fe-2S iron-sulfur cluster-binding protein [Hyphomicrobiales bacterium]
MSSITLRVNGSEVTGTVEPRMHLADFVREDLHLTGTHIGCEHGVCGACTVMVDGHPVRSCLVYAVSCDGAEVHTIEGFDDDPLMEALRSAFKRHHGLQCGYCTPGMLTTAYDIVARLGAADEARIREELAGNLCRCTGYAGIVAAIKEVLAAGPHISRIKPNMRSAPDEAQPRFDESPLVAPEGHGRVRALPPDAPAAAFPDPIQGGVTLARSIAVACPEDRLWATLQDIEGVARCLPGATLEETGPGGQVAGAFTVAIGPMRASFRGRAVVRFDAASRAGEVRGNGSDGSSRSRAEGAIRFSARPETGNRSRLDLDITYKLQGPLAQFGRPALVAEVIDRLLARFASNLAEAAAGKAITPAAPIGGIRLVSALLLDAIRRLLTRK